eukprot:gene17693-45248_t
MDCGLAWLWDPLRLCGGLRSAPAGEETPGIHLDASR